MAMVAEMVAMAVVKVLINYYLQKHLEIRKPSSLSMRVCFMAFTREIYFFSLTKKGYRTKSVAILVPKIGK